MPCNQAVSITKAAIANEALRDLATPAMLAEALRAYLTQQGKQERTDFTLNVYDSFVRARIGNHIVVIERGQVTVTTYDRNLRTEGTALQDEIAAIVAALADEVFTQQVRAALATLGPITTKTTTVTNEGQQQQATVITLRV